MPARRASRSSCDSGWSEGGRLATCRKRTHKARGNEREFSVVGVVVVVLFLKLNQAQSCLAKTTRDVVLEVTALREGCGERKSCEGVCPNSLIWCSMAFE